MAYGLLICSLAFAQEESPPASAPPPGGSPPAASPAGTTPPLSASVTPAPSSGAPQLTDVLFKNLKARSIGPSVMGGRVSDIAIDPRNPSVFYVGLGHGGVFKSGNGGISFDPIFDKQPVLSIGAIAIAPSDSDVDLGWNAAKRTIGIPPNGATAFIARPMAAGHWTNVGLKGQPNHCADRCRSKKSGRRLRRGDGKSLGGWRRTRPLQDDGRRQNVEANSARGCASQRPHRLWRCRARSNESARSFTQRSTRGNARRGRLPTA